ncbi:hypothetical protein F2Q68_00033676 [Brassica cretica]|uniref:Uncharacterized protein n=2 Tax=Brassica cretica TaxID=69181 RepID=A0A8S9HAX7_BRACR|nr:hypothetical protein F2Q68_00033676 [Brassica cretica]KAF3592921.1 hypothetical protein DY000_02020718 [Brassica cretica]
MIEKKSLSRKEGAARFDRRGASSSSSSPDQRGQIGERKRRNRDNHRCLFVSGKTDGFVGDYVCMIPPSL